MEFPHGHDSGDDDDGTGSYQPPRTGVPGYAYDQPPPPQQTFLGGAYHQPSTSAPYPYLSQDFGYTHPPPPPQQQYWAYQPQQAPQQQYYPHMPSSFHDHTEHQSAVLAELANKPTHRVYCKADPNYSLTVRDEQVILAQTNPDDPYQHWYKDEKYSSTVEDEEGFPCFALVNKQTGLAMKHSVGASRPVQLIPYTSDRLDESILWTMSRDFGDGYRTIRMVNNIRLIVDAFHGDKKSGGVHEGTTIVLCPWNKGDNQLWKKSKPQKNQLWKITPYN